MSAAPPSSEPDIVDRARRLLDGVRSSPHFSGLIFMYPGFSIVHAHLTQALAEAQARGDCDVTTPLSEELMPRMMAGHAAEQQRAGRPEVALAIVGGKVGLNKFCSNTVPNGLGLQAPGVILVVNPENAPAPGMPTHQSVHHASLLTEQAIERLLRGAEERERAALDALLGPPAEGHAPLQRALAEVRSRTFRSLAAELVNHIEDRTGLREVELADFDELSLVPSTMARAAREQRMIAVHISSALLDPRRARDAALYEPPRRVDLAALREDAVEHVREDDRVLCVLGRGCLGPEAQGALGRIAARSDHVLFATTLGAHGLVEVPAHRSVGLVGSLGSSGALSALREADLVLVLGARWPDVVLGINVNADLHLAVKAKSAQVVLKEQDVSPLVSRYAVGDAVQLLCALADALPERHTRTFCRPDRVDVADLRAGRVHPMVAALGEVIDSLPSGELAVELGAGCVSIFQGAYASERQDVPIALSHDGSMGELGYTLALRRPRFVFVQVGDGEARMGLHLYLGEAVRAARLAPRGTAPDRIIVVWDNEDLYNISLLDQRTHGHSHFVQRIPVQWARLADEFPDAPSLVAGARCKDEDELRATLRRWVDHPERPRILVVHAVLGPEAVTPPISAARAL
ncbi:hypothetical protein [Sorangium sp. So ce854]|uniref:hypothetical protein n=1 Tax=Sorangium sp. So ce854 TaxID=3133322 RepID=UPI003F63A5EB